ncbi:amidohydrolase [Piscinibacter sakaiensis]|uniref:Exoenzymes regulatory protein AepA n=1 Tax=Piscinibacter sakaiensis TaxID=1547922 RepID=A0A0K8NZH9_PISS1|nr:amidohydrolase [Piscinibacter sakaiensis]GAP35791.1 exoenzymes regulatory protein AepA [Piscinibacter sakaiensis]
MTASHVPAPGAASVGAPAPVTVFVARRILTMNPRQPVATHVAVREGRILAVGDLARMAAWGPFTLDERFADQVLMPGLVEGHSHLMAGGLWQFPYVGFHPRTDPDGRVWPACRDFDAVVRRLAEASAALDAAGEPDAPLTAWGFDPIFMGTARMTADHLDRVSTRRPVIVLHASQHLMNVNRVALAKAGIDRDCEIEGVTRDAAGEPSGELCEFAAMFPIQRLIGNIFRRAGGSEAGLRMFGRIATLAGVTTATDLVNDLGDEMHANLARLTAEPDFPVRVVPAFVSLDGSMSPEAGVEHVRRRMAANTDKLVCGPVKLVADGSIQGFTARLRWPGYVNGAPNGIWVMPPAVLGRLVETYHAAGLQLHIHTNGDEATQVALDAVEAALLKHPRPDHRHTLQHCQMADAAQFRRMARLGMCANLFANHLFHWGDAHVAQTMGPDRAHRMDACATALESGVPLAIHSDAPITPLAPLFTAWCAVNRISSGGEVLGEGERITVAQALHAITLGAAWTLHLDDRIGSIEVGKWADFCVLGEDPTAVDPMRLKDVPVLGTVLGGRVFEAPREVHGSAA